MIENLKPSEVKSEREDYSVEGTPEKDFSLNSADGRASEEELKEVRAELNGQRVAKNIIPVDFKAETPTEEISVKPTAKSGGKVLNKIKQWLGLGLVIGTLGNEAKGQDVAATTVGVQQPGGTKVVFQETRKTANPQVFNYNQKDWPAVTEKDQEISRRAAEKLRTGESFWGGNPGTPPSNEPTPVNPPNAQESNIDQSSQPSADNGGVVMGGYVDGGPPVHGGYVPGGGADRRGVSRGGDRYYGPVSPDGYVKEYNAGGPRQARRSAFMHKIVKDSGNEVITDGKELFKNPFKGKFFKPYGDRDRK